MELFRLGWDANVNIWGDGVDFLHSRFVLVTWLA